MLDARQDHAADMPRDQDERGADQRLVGLLDGSGGAGPRLAIAEDIVTVNGGEPRLGPSGLAGAGRVGDALRLSREGLVLVAASPDGADGDDDPA